MSTGRLKHVAEIRVSNVDKKSVDGDIPVKLCNYTDVYYNERITADLDFMTATATPDQRRNTFPANPTTGLGSSKPTPTRTRLPSRTQVCRRLANYVGNYDYIQQGTSVRAFDILFHTLQRSCPKEAHAGGFDADAGNPSCVNVYDSRFKCQAFNDPNFPSAPTSALIADYQGNG